MSETTCETLTLVPRQLIEECLCPSHQMGVLLTEIVLAYGQMLRQMSVEGLDEEAERLYRRCLEAGDADAHNNLGVMLHNMGRVEEAERELRKGNEAGDAMDSYRRAVELGFAPARWKLASLERQADPATRGLEVWIGAVHVRPNLDKDVFDGGAGAFCTVAALVRDEAEYREVVAPPAGD